MVKKYAKQSQTDQQDISNMNNNFAEYSTQIKLGITDKNGTVYPTATTQTDDSKEWSP